MSLSNGTGPVAPVNEIATIRLLAIAFFLGWCIQYAGAFSMVFVVGAVLVASYPLLRSIGNLIVNAIKMFLAGRKIGTPRPIES